MNQIMARWQRFLNSTMAGPFDALSLLLLRIFCGGGLAIHGWSKFRNFSNLSDQFPDPLNLKSSSLSLALAIFGELVCGALVAVGLLTRLFVIPALFTMCVAIFVVHAQDPYSEKELAVLYAVGLLVLLLKGAGVVSFDGLAGKGSSKSSSSRQNVAR